eukprot:scaffold44386_cov20-Tisochrysis_lutea.AAC.1
MPCTAPLDIASGFSLLDTLNTVNTASGSQRQLVSCTATLNVHCQGSRCCEERSPGCQRQPVQIVPCMQAGISEGAGPAKAQHKYASQRPPQLPSPAP